jgi:hypothetical protein
MKTGADKDSPFFERTFTMSFISTSDATLFRSPELPVASKPIRHRLLAVQPQEGWSVGSTLEFVLALATSAAVSLILCTTAVGALSN